MYKLQKTLDLHELKYSFNPRAIELIVRS